MWIDLNASPTDPFAGRTFDIAIGGAGPAGITLARALAAKGFGVLLLEAGGVEPDRRSQSVYDGRSVGPHRYWGVESCRLRYFGGTSNHWSGRVARLEPVDFERREGFDPPGWPIGWHDVNQYTGEVSDILDLDRPLDADRDEPGWRDPLFPASRFARSAPTRFGPKYAGEIRDSRRILAVVNANLLDIRLDADRRRADTLDIADYGGRSFKAKARVVVIAFGAIENARFLLNARSDVEAGLGNQSDMVGRCFMEHPDFVLGRVAPSDAALWDRETPLSLAASPALIRRAALNNALVGLNPSAKLSFHGRLAPLRRVMRDATCAMRPPIDFSAPEKDESLVCEGDGVVSAFAEQSPNRDSRVMLDEAFDQFGKRRVILDWRFNDQDWRSYRTLGIEVGKSIARQGLGRLRLADELLSQSFDPGRQCHQMGTTRMAANPKDGVVDADCRVFGLDNLYVAGASVFPTGGAANPTFTIVALALRLAEHLAARAPSAR